MKCRSSDSKFRDRLTQTTIVVAESDDDQQIPDRIVDEFIELPSAKPKEQNEILVDLMMRREDELFDEIIEQEKFSVDETSDGESLERMADKVELVTIREKVIAEQQDSIDEFNDEDLITISEQMSDLVTGASDDSEIYDKIDLGFGNENERPTPNRLHLPKRSQVLPAEEMIVEREDHENYQIIFYNGIACCGCDKYFSSLDDLDFHCREHHKLKRQPGGMYCSLCNKKFPSLSIKIRHATQRSIPKLYACKLCEYVCRDRAAIERHMEFSVIHKKPMMRFDKVKEAFERIPVDGHLCCDCYQMFPDKAQLEKHHQDAHHPNREHVDQVHQVKLLENELRRKKSTHVCSICNCNFESRRALKRHLSVKIKNFVCDQCGLSVASAFQLRSHVQQVHSNVHIQKNFNCNECPRSFVSEANLQRHKRRGHDKPSDNVCSICGKQFKNKETLWHHWRIHNKTESLECEPCKKAGRRYQFRDLKTLRRHYKISEMHNGERKHKCTYEGCTNAYAHKPDLQRHEQTVHRGDRPFQCKVCGKGFVRNRDLRLHERHHTGAKLFSCEDCSEGFNVFKEYKKHFSEVHGKVFMIKCEMGNLGSRK
ncbi:AAEL006618-PA [Aedes aegypti]|uniref:AAEL006618-PA n=1 Tax=Aedes aegypti TaxID=7159 RepID=Q175N7_AEDAE|nr:AAEL006618-PA [Aedes aegypti]